MSQPPEKRKRKNDEVPGTSGEYWDPQICPLCGCTDFRWGHTNMVFHEKPKSIFRYDDETEVMHARQCLRCGNVQLFAELD